MKKLLLWVIGCWVCGTLSAQEKFVVPGGAGTKNGSSWENAMASIAEALEEGTTVKVGKGVYGLAAELQIPSGKTVSGGWDPATGVRMENFAAQTVLRPLSGALHRVATVAGRLEGVTVENGVVIQGKGGGVYITSTGVVENCIIRNNMAAQYYPKVGDAYCSDGTFLAREEITAENVNRIEGIVFWVNPDPKAPAGQRGWIAKWNYDYGGEWSATQSENITRQLCNTAEAAVADTAGFALTQTVRAAAGANPGLYKAVEACGDDWYLPAMGQLRRLHSELFWVEATVKVIIDLTGSNMKSFWDMGMGYWSVTEGVSGSEVGVWSIDGYGGCRLNGKDSFNMVIPVKSF